MSGLGDKLKELNVWSFLGLLLQGDSLLGLGLRGLFLRLGFSWDLFVITALVVSWGLTFFLLTAVTSGGFRNCSGSAFFSPGSGSDKTRHNQHVSRVKREKRVFPRDSQALNLFFALCFLARSNSSADVRWLDDRFTASQDCRCLRFSFPARRSFSRAPGRPPPGEGAAGRGDARHRLALPAPRPAASRCPQPPLPDTTPSAAGRAPPGER